MSPPAKNTRLASLDVAPLLSRAPKGDRIRLKWDMACDGLQSYDRSLKTHIASSVCLGDPALSTPTPSLIITIAGAPYPYTIRVDRSPLPTAPPFVTVRDVLQAVHAHLGETITPQEMQSAATQTDVWNAALATWRHRTNGDAMRRMRRIDFLGGRTVFFGLASAGPARVLGKSELPRLELLVGKRES
ncbi:uncharacterized protein B0H18DRAFT_959010 [Fomitopsis serialis]|uniref:uncharacterized protein n=1 Tax=Fomitopsis serialis TaxID=139415 RepID=UPI002007596C|nr:uncharacterized protein B0H18DRAFT_959010 [Neoantrodia serialis]KAH9916021.1 hypothetical protein B0H18DRAFT_959010 [Neoantrodia serialis]